MNWRVKKFQQGGQVEPQQQDPMMQLIQIAQQAIQEKNADLAFQVCQTLVELAQGGGQPQEQPQGGEGEQPVFAKGGRLLRRY